MIYSTQDDFCSFFFSDPARFLFISPDILRDEGKSELLWLYFFLGVYLVSLRSEKSERDRFFVLGWCFLDGIIRFTLTWARVYDTRLSTLVWSFKGSGQRTR
jgi:hypothetical protein